MNNLSLHIKANFFNSSVSAVKLAEINNSDKNIKFAESLLKIKNTTTEFKLNKTTIYNGSEIKKSEKYSFLTERISVLKESKFFLTNINNGNYRKVVSPQVHSMMIHQRLNQRIAVDYKGMGEVRNVRATINSISQDVIKSNSWDVVDKFESFSRDIDKMMEKKVDISEIEKRTLDFKKELNTKALSH
ncbi:hypothetical protein [Yersinia kristensenii]|uniref:hypothetical protein n=1 Tax=Yersinia kristensenii TaxID=28152 RepID=UPI0005E91B8E|nr:hypothetical protein [Yersinia kristensenii]CNF40712.1 Uncharacterised protein [Yersinia kristensenii]